MSSSGGGLLKLSPRDSNESGAFVFDAHQFSCRKVSSSALPSIEVTQPRLPLSKIFGRIKTALAKILSTSN